MLSSGHCPSAVYADAQPTAICASPNRAEYNWREVFPEVFQKGGFDVVVGNPPYIRQEWISEFKPYLQSNFKAFHGTADIYVYFYELGMRVLRPGGRLSFIVTNKWLKAAYGAPLRKFFSQEAWIEAVIDFGHAKQIFEDADVFPSIIVARKPVANEPPPNTATVCSIPREQLRINDLNMQIETEGVEVERSRLGEEPWMLEPRSVFELLAKMEAHSVPLVEFGGIRPLSGIKTGFNNAFLIDSATRQALISADPKCSDLIKRYLRGQDIDRWQANWAGLWMIAMKSSGDHSWPWADAGDNAEAVFRESFPSLHAHMKGFEEQLQRRQDQGRFWWELRTCAYGISSRGRN